MNVISPTLRVDLLNSPGFPWSTLIVAVSTLLAGLLATALANRQQRGLRFLDMKRDAFIELEQYMIAGSNYVEWILTNSATGMTTNITKPQVPVLSSREEAIAIVLMGRTVRGRVRNYVDKFRDMLRAEETLSELELTLSIGGPTDAAAIAQQRQALHDSAKVVETIIEGIESQMFAEIESVGTSPRGQKPRK
jgi:hypothetical protein